MAKVPIFRVSEHLKNLDRNLPYRLTASVELLMSSISPFTYKSYHKWRKWSINGPRIDGSKPNTYPGNVELELAHLFVYLSLSFIILSYDHYQISLPTGFYNWSTGPLYLRWWFFSHKYRSPYWDATEDQLGKAVTEPRLLIVQRAAVETAFPDKWEGSWNEDREVLAGMVD